jgi:hypothetical protein
VHLRWRPQLRDPDDELVLEAAVNGRADALVTDNVKDFRDVAQGNESRLPKTAKERPGWSLVDVMPRLRLAIVARFCSMTAPFRCTKLSSERHKGVPTRPVNLSSEPWDVAPVSASGSRGPWTCWTS